MGLEISGKPVVRLGRSAISTSDSTYPSGAVQAGSVAVPPRARGAKTHVIIDITSDGSPSCVAHLFGYLADTDTWYWLDSINNGGAIDQGLHPVDDGTSEHFAEVLDHASLYDRLWISITSLTGTATQRFIFETLHD